MADDQNVDGDQACSAQQHRADNSHQKMLPFHMASTMRFGPKPRFDSWHRAARRNIDGHGAG